MLCCFLNCSGVDVHFHGAQVLQLVLIPLVCRTFRRHKFHQHSVRELQAVWTFHRACYLPSPPVHAALRRQSAAAHYQKSGSTSISVQFVHGSRQTPKERIYSNRMPLKQCSFLVVRIDSLLSVLLYCHRCLLQSYFLSIFTILESSRPCSAVIVCSGGGAAHFTHSPSLCVDPGGSSAELPDNN